MIFFLIRYPTLHNRIKIKPLAKVVIASLSGLLVQRGFVTKTLKDNATLIELIQVMMCAELAGDFHLGDSRQLTDKSLLPFDLVS